MSNKKRKNSDISRDNDLQPISKKAKKLDENGTIELKYMTKYSPLLPQHADKFMKLGYTFHLEE